MKYLRISNINIDTKDLRRIAPILLSLLATIGLGYWWLSDYKKKIVYDAYKRGFVDCSVIYEKMFKDQTEKFIQEKESWQDRVEEYEKLIDTYEEWIDTIEKKENKSKNDTDTLILLKANKEKLENIRTA